MLKSAWCLHVCERMLLLLYSTHTQRNINTTPTFCHRTRPQQRLLVLGQTFVLLIHLPNLLQSLKRRVIVIEMPLVLLLLTVAQVLLPSQQSFRKERKTLVWTLTLNLSSCRDRLLLKSNEIL